MHEAFRPISLVVAFWPTQDFQFPGDLNAFGERLRQQAPLFSELRISPPGGPEMQPEWPRLIVLGDERRLALELAPGKISLRVALNQPASLDQIVDSTHQTLAPVLAWLAENFDFRVYRLGTLIQLFCNTRSSANEKIAQYFLQPRALQGQPPHEIQLGILSRVNLYDDVLVNRWLRVRPLRTIDPRRVDFAAQIEVDINTLPEDTRVKNARDILDFFLAIARYLDTQVPLLNDGEFVD